MCNLIGSKLAAKCECGVTGVLIKNEKISSSSTRNSKCPSYNFQIRTIKVNGFETIGRGDVVEYA